MESTYVIHWPYLAFALLMLLFPRAWLRFGKWQRRRRKQRELFDKFARDGGNDPDDKSVKLTRELANKRNYIDFFRAAAGAYALWHFSVSDLHRDARFIFIGGAAVVTLAGILLQSVRLGTRATFYAPIFYLAGVSIGMGSFFAGGFAFLLVCAINPVIPNPRLFITAYGLLLLPFNFLFSAGVPLMVVNTALVLAIPLVSLLARRPVVILTKKANLA